MKRTVLTVLFLLAASVGYADDTQRGQTYEIGNFSGGLAEKQSPFSIKSNQAVVSENTRFNDPYGAISKRTNLRVYGTADVLEPITGMFRHYMKNGDKVLVVTHGDEIEKGNDTTGVFTNILNLTTGDHKWQFVTWHDILIGSDGYNQPVKYDGSSSSATYLGAPLATLASSGSGPAAGDYSYKCACYSATYTILLDTPSNTITANGNDVNLSMIPICTDTTLNGEATTGRKIYRTETNGSTYKLLSNGVIANNTAVTLVDSDADGALGAAMPAGDATWAPPKGKYLLVQNNRLFFANDPSSSPSRVWYSEDASHDIFKNDQYLDVRQNDGDAITFMKGNLGLLTIGKNNTIQRVYIDGADPDVDWSISDPLSYVGCQAPYSAVNSSLGILYLAKDGIYRFNGQYSELISESVTPTIKDISQTDLENVWAVYHDNFYHLAYRSTSSGEAFNNRVLVLDILAKAYSVDLLSINAFATFNSGNDFGVLYAGSSENGNIYAYSNEVNEVIHKRHSDFTGLWDDMRYIPESVDGDSQDPILEIARTETINELVGTINSQTGTIDRQDTVGHYVSQPLQIGATSLDKLYWNEVTPSDGTVTFKIRTSPTGEANLLHNDDFEFWDNFAFGPTPTVAEPNDWTYTQSGTGGSATANSIETHRGTLSTQITKSTSGTSIIARSIPNASNYRNKTMAFNGWFKSANSVANAVYFQVTDGLTTKTYNYTNTGGWVEAATSLTISSTANTITAKCVVSSTANAVAYFDQVMLIQGSTAENDWSAWSSDFTNSAGSDISNETANTYLQYLINLETDDITVTPTIVKQSGYNVKISYGKEGVAQSSSIPLHYTTGWLDLGQPSRPKILRGFETYHTGTSGTLTFTITNFEGDTDTFNIDLSAKPTHYKEWFTSGALRGRQFKIDITNSGILPVSVEKILLKFDTEPESGDF